MRRFDHAPKWLLGVMTLVAGSGASDAQDLASTAASRQDVSLTVYNGDLCLVRERRTIETRDGTFRLRYEDVTAGINPATVSLQATGRGAPRIVEQNYEYDLISQATLMGKYVGHTVGYRSDDGARGTAKLLSAHDGYVYDLGGQIVFELPGDVVLDALPDELSARPTLVWTLEADLRGQQDVEVSYLSTGVSWHADYVLALDEPEARGQLTGWVTLDNRSGAAFENAQLKLVAGDVNRVREVMQRLALQSARFTADAMPQFQEQSFFEYHMYTLQRRTNLKNNQTKQVLFFNADGITVSKAYRFHGNPARLSPQYKAAARSEHVDVLLRLQNSTENHLGLPIPEGIVRVYKADADGAKQFLGENRVAHTPKDERLEFAVGRAFDVVGEHVQTDYRRIADRAYEVAFEVKLRNHKTEAIEVVVEEEFAGDWKILSSSIPFEKASASTATFAVSVGADTETVLTYRVQIQP